jgi:cell division protein FtsA
MIDLHETQRAMRVMRRAAFGRGLVAVLDVGTSKVACFVLRLEQPRAAEFADVGPMAGLARIRVVGSAITRSRGVRFGEVASLRETEAAIRTVVQAAEHEAGERVDHVVAGLSGADPRSHALSGVVLVKGEVTEACVARAMAECAPPDLGPGRHVLHAQPVHFALDHRMGLADPRGLRGQRLFCDMHLLDVDAEAVRAVVEAVKRCDLEVAGLTASAQASGLAALVEDERELGAACVDLGGGATSVSIFARRHMVHAGAVRMGGEHVTSDVQMGLHVAESTAERIKTLHGGVHATGLDDRERIEVGGGTGDWEADRRTVTRAELIGVMRPRVEEILEEARGVLDAAGFEDLPTRRVVLTGGGSQIPGITDLAARILGAQVRLGRPIRLRGVPETATGPAFSALTGLCLEAAQPEDARWDFALPEDEKRRLGLGRAVRWLRANW